MAKQQIRSYAFTPGTAGNGTVEIMGRWALEQITLITNVTRNVFLYNFADAAFIGTSVTFNRANSTNFPQALQASDGTTTIRLAIDTTGYNGGDSLQIFVERAETITRPWPIGTDAFERTRMAAPQSMLDADFEYGLQPTKWQTVSTVRTYPGIYEIPGSDLVATAMTTNASGGGSKPGIASLITVTTINPHQLSTGTAITIQNLDTSITGADRAQGSFVINTITSPYIFNYYARNQVGTLNGQSLLTAYTIVRRGGFYTGSTIGTTTFVTAGSGAASTGTITATFANTHGLMPGSGIYTVMSSDNGSNNHTLAQGPFYVQSVPNPDQITYYARDVGTITGNPTGVVYARADSFYQHRPFDGGVSLGAGGPSYGSQAIRMSKKYIRYQSGKSINYNTAALFAPNYNIRSAIATGTSTGSVITITTDDLDHGLQPGAIVGLNNFSSSGYNGNYTVTGIVDERTFTTTATTALSTTTAEFGVNSYVYHVNWHGATIRAGTYDEQNGIFWQYDGIQMAIGLRSSTLQLAGTVNVTPDINLVTGNSTQFLNQLAAGDRVVIKGMTHMVSAITSATYMYVNPDYRGSTSTTSAKMVKTQDILVPQSQWNMDRCDGSNGPFNPSGYNLLPYKLQMIGLQWTWYGAGFIEWMLRASDGNYIVVHRMKNSNVNQEAYMRSGNQPVRYEVINEGARDVLAQTLGSSYTTAMTLTNVTYFPPSGTVYIDNELIRYTSITTATNTLNGLTRTATLTPWVAGTLTNYTATATSAVHTAGTGVILASQTATPTISHWGSAFLTDGGFDQDRGYIFNYQAPNITVSTKKTTAFAIRLAPSVSNAAVGDLGVRDLINRSQLLLQSIENTAGGGATGAGSQAIVIEGVLNPSNFPSNVSNITWYTLQGSVPGGSLLGSGQPSFAQIAPSSTINFDGVFTATTTVSNTTATNANSNFVYVASTASIAIGDAVITSVPASQGGQGIAGNTLVQTVGNGFITLTQPVLSSLATNSALSFFRNSWATPGETIFSFISSPASKDSLDLSPLKELTNTPIGGRGTFPNGPDTLFINIYLTSGPNVQSNLVLRWGEAQA
jgi:hypothetical protein